MAEPYFPTTDAGSLAFMMTLRDNVALDPALYGFVQADSDQITLVVDAYENAWNIAVNPMTRTKATITAKDLTKKTAMDLCRGYAMDCKFNDGVSDQAKEDIGVRPPNTDRTPIPTPTTAPGLQIVASMQGVHEVRYYDPANGNSKAKPRGALAMELWIGMAEANIIVTNPADCAAYGAFTTTPIGVQFAASENGRQATYYSRWVGKDGEVGPWSTLQSLAVSA